MDRRPLQGRGRAARGAVAAAAGLALCAAVLALPARSGAQPAASLCIVLRTPAEGLEIEGLRPALALEWTKSRLALEARVVVAPAPEACLPGSGGPSALLMLTGATALLLGPGGATLSQDLDAVAPIDRSQDVARRVVGVFAAEVRRGHPVLVDGSRQPAKAAVRPGGPAPAAYVMVGGRYAWQPSGGRHRLATDLEGGVSLHDERYQAGLRVGLEPGQEAAGNPFAVRVLAVPVTLQARVGGPVHPRVRVRGALGLGIEWRRLDAAVPDRPGGRRVEGFVPLVEAEVEAVFAPTRVLRVGVAGLVRGFVGGDTLTWQGTAVYTPPRVALGLVLRVGVILPDRGVP